MIGKIGNIYFNMDNIETYEFINNGKSIIINLVSGRSFMYDVDDVPGLVEYLKNLKFEGIYIL